MIKFFPFLLLLPLLIACESKYKIDGSTSFSGFDGKYVYLKCLQNGDWVTVDSTEVIHGLFSMCGVVDSVQMTTLFIGEESIMPMVLEQGNITINMSFPQFSARGTLLNDALYDFVENRRELDIQVEELSRKAARMVLDGVDLSVAESQVAAESEKLKKDIEQYVNTFITDNYENVLGPNVFIMLCNTLPYPVLTPQIEDIIRTAPSVFKEHVLVQEFLTAAKANMERIKEQQRMVEQE
ncbi:DUF4369 domain-containing protein [Bacteroides sp. 214]|uniref:DUF4369 domain-containing protein n=1 Tax=Bacteroides sp. 214 TaxID=2302935 RepID=UPI0013D0E41E|nr:DUF4369 domain-containing protein [Bacteroides sp. 214]NDW11504.1 DUF4369 domain-containing protein [Bacteroides sp. 214]